MSLTTITDRRQLATLATLGIGLFVALVVLLPFLKGDGYDPVDQAMSELALGRYGGLMTLAFFSLGTGVLALGVAVRRFFGATRAVPGLLIVAGVLGVLSGVFKTNGASAATIESQIHEIVGITLFVLVVVAMFLSVRVFRREPAWTRFARYSLGWAVAATCTFFLVPALEEAAFGMAQRLFAATWLSWMLVLAWRLRRAETTNEPVAPTAAVLNYGS